MNLILRAKSRHAKNWAATPVSKTNNKCANGCHAAHYVFHDGKLSWCQNCAEKFVEFSLGRAEEALLRSDAFVGV